MSTFSTSESPIFILDHRKRAFVITCVLSAILIAEIYATLIYNLPFFGTNGGMFEAVVYNAVFAAFAAFAFLKSKRLEFYQESVRFSSRLGVVNEIPYKETYLLPFPGAKIFRMVRLFNGQPVEGWNIKNSAISKPDGTITTLYETILPKSEHNFDPLTFKTGVTVTLDSRKLNRFVLLGTIGAGIIVLGSYFLYIINAGVQYDLNYGLPVTFSQLDYLELYFTALGGFIALIIAIFYLHSGSKNLPSINKVLYPAYRFRLSISGEISLLVILLAVVLTMVLTTIYLLPAINSSGITSIVPGLFFILTGGGLMMLIIISAVGLASFLHEIGPGPKRKMLAIVTVLICVSLAAPIVGDLYGSYAYPVDYNAIQTLTNVNLTIRYPNNLSNGYLGLANQSSDWGGGGNYTMLGGRHISLWTYLKMQGGQCCSNTLSHVITNFTTTNKGFSITSVYPALPYHITQSVGVNISYTLVTPHFNYTGPLFLQITTT